MEFCDICDNMLYMKQQENSLTKYCKHCDFSKEVDGPSSGRALKVMETLYSEDDLLYMQHQNKYLRFDPTLPRVQDPHIVCPSESCPGPKDKPQVVYVKYHPVHMKYFYCCDYCGTSWRTKK